MKKYYIILGATSGGVSGGIIYHLNKLKFMRMKGWESFIISTNDGEVMVSGLSDYILCKYTFLNQFPNSFPPFLLYKNLQLLIDKLGEIEACNMIIESSTETTSLWGELLASKLSCRHIVIFINEFSLCMTPSLASFFKFKFDRGELACISKKHMKKIFKKFWEVDENNAISLPCSCTNSLQKVESKYNTLKLNGKSIGYIGRIDKPFFEELLVNILDYCQSNKNEYYNILIFGGSNQNKAIDNVNKLIKGINNVSVTITGFIYPIPLEATQKSDVIFACAGSAYVGYKTGKPTICIDNLNYKLIGVIKSINPLTLEKCPNGNTYKAYLSWLLETSPNINIAKYDLALDEKSTYQSIEKHTQFISKINSELLYYSIEKIPIVYYKDNIKRVLRRIFHNNLLFLKNPINKFILRKN